MTSWLNEHIETFVKPTLVGTWLDTSNSLETEKLSQNIHINSNQMTIIKNAWRSVKKQAHGRKVLLMGRDVWVFEVLARREGFPTYFDPQCSRAAASCITLPFDKKNCVLFDTGFMGSIARILKVDFILLSAEQHLNSKQVFPRLTNSRSLALFLEELPKYWKCAYQIDGKPHQELANKTEFERAARLTMQVYKDSSPRFVNNRKPIGGRIVKGWNPDEWMI